MTESIIIINTFPNTDEKIKMLQEQITHFKTTNYPILIISGCDIPEHISSKVDYVIINKENEILDKKFNYNIVKYCKKMIIKSPFLYFLTTDDFAATFYTSKVDSTIVKNIKLSFNLAKLLGYKNAFYTEDDNLFKEKSFVENNLKLINDKYKIVGYLTNEGNKYKKVYTTFFFSNINFLLEKFTIPSSRIDWEKEENISKYSLHKILEGSFYDMLKNDLHLLYNIENNVIKLEKLGDIILNINDRNNNENFTIDNFYTVLNTNKNEKYLFLFNKFKTHNISIFFDNVFKYSKELPENGWHFNDIPTETKKVKLIINNKIEKIIDIDENIKYNGYINFK